MENKKNIWIIIAIVFMAISLISTYFLVSSLFILNGELEKQDYYRTQMLTFCEMYSTVLEIAESSDESFNTSDLTVTPCEQWTIEFIEEESSKNP